MKVITVGKSYIDIDGYASAIAYQKLLTLQGIEAKFVSNAMLNYSITNSLLNTGYGIDDYQVTDNDEFIILDLSNKTYFPEFVNEDKIVEIIDHHPGFETYWSKRLGNKALIKPIGSVATLIVEKYEQANLFNQIDTNLAKLLMAAILDNTLNFTAKITTSKDIETYQKLTNLINNEDFASNYFLEVENTIITNLNEAIKNDIKITHINDWLPDSFGQLTIWDASLIKETELRKIMDSYSDKWLMNLISLKDNTSYLIVSNNMVLDKLNQFLKGDNIDLGLILKPAMLRKEIMQKAIQQE
ncbi:MAG: DHH family phosphoesterase [Bacilli bacterium]|nr:DHH family phosphoesterase [Bacilli bacterium]